MADPRFIPQPLNILGGVAQVEQIRGARAAQDLAQQRFGLAQQQLQFERQQAVAEQEIRAQQRASEKRGREIDLLSKRLQKETNPDAIRSIGGRLNALTTEEFAGSPDIDFETLAQDQDLLKQFQRDFGSFETLSEDLGEDDPTVRLIRDNMINKYGKFPERIAEVRAVGAPERLFRRQEALKEKALPGAIKREEQKIKAEAKVKLDLAEQERARRADVVKSLELPVELEQTVLASIQAGVQLPDPQAQARAKRQADIQNLQIIRQQLSAVDVNEEFLVKGTERKQFEVLQKMLLRAGRRAALKTKRK
jgi:hypothetical protein